MFTVARFYLIVSANNYHAFYLPYYLLCNEYGKEVAGASGTQQQGEGLLPKQQLLTDESIRLSAVAASSLFRFRIHCQDRSETILADGAYSERPLVDLV
jgi:hypothetical protein